MLNKKGFTLIELLVVIAIITILASIVVPRVTTYIARGKMARAVSEIRNCDLALVKMLADADRTSFGHILKWVDNQGRVMPPPAYLGDGVNDMAEATDIYTKAFYELLRRGKDASLSDLQMAIPRNVKTKLASSYMDLGPDPWGTAYQFYIGTLNRVGQVNGVYRRCPFRSYRDPINEGDSTYYYNANAVSVENQTVRGNPPPDDGPGFPAPRDLPAYIFSMGADTTVNQFPVDRFPGSSIDPTDPDHNGGDDINNWDHQSGWGGFY